ncbi:unnamed protein product [Sympodiomycopsis kandeliae]
MTDYPPSRSGYREFDRRGPPPPPRGGSYYDDPPAPSRGYDRGGYGYSDSSSGSYGGGMRGPPGREPPRTLFVAGFPPEMRAADLAYYFERLGPLVRCDIPALKSIQSKPYAFVEYEDSRDAAAAHAEMHGVRFGGHAISLQFAKNTPGANWRFGGAPGERGAPPSGSSGAGGSSNGRYGRRERSPSPVRRSARDYDDRGSYSRPPPRHDDRGRDRWDDRRRHSDRDDRGPRSDDRREPATTDRKENGHHHQGDKDPNLSEWDEPYTSTTKTTAQDEPAKTTTTTRENALTPPPAAVDHADEEREPVDV